MEENTNNEQYLDDGQLHDVTGGVWFGTQRAHTENMTPAHDKDRIRMIRADAENGISMLQKGARFYAERGHDQAVADHLVAINSITDKIKGF